MLRVLEILSVPVGFAVLLWLAEKVSEWRTLIREARDARGASHPLRAPQGHSVNPPTE
jgi:hypothetical protein